MAFAFHQDLAQEQLLRPFLDRTYVTHGIRCKRSTDLEDQRQGIDLWLCKDGYRYAVDEKAQLHYIGHSLPTFAFEVDLLHSGEQRPGWLFDPTKRTEVYALVFDIMLMEDRSELRSEADIASVEVVLVNRSRLINHLLKAGLSAELLQRMADELRATGDRTRTVQPPGVRLVASPQLTECPVNLLLTRRFLCTIGQVLRSTGDQPSANGVSQRES